MVNGSLGVRRGGRSGAVKAIWRRSGATGRSTPAIAPTAVDHAPAAQTTVDVATVPVAVRTPVISSPLVSMPTTADRVWIRTSRPAAAPAYPCTTDAGRAYPSSGENAAASRPSGSRYGQR